MIWFDGTHPDIKRAVDRAVLAYIQEGIDVGKTGNETFYIDIYRKWYTISWDKLRLKYSRCKPCRPAGDASVAMSDLQAVA